MKTMFPLRSKICDLRNMMHFDLCPFHFNAGTGLCTTRALNLEWGELLIGHSGLREWRNEVDVVTGVKLTFFNWLSNGRRQKAGGWLVGQPIIDCASHCGGSCDTCHAISSRPGGQSKYCAPLLFPQPSFFSLAHHPSIHHPALSPAHPPLLSFPQSLRHSF